MTEKSDTDRILEEIKRVEVALDKRITCLEKKLLDPDEGLFCRVKDNTDFRKSAMKWIYFIAISVAGLIGKVVYDYLTKKVF